MKGKRAYLVIPVALAVALQGREREREKDESAPHSTPWAGWVLGKVRVWEGSQLGQPPQ